jgi:Reverse transcriptase (RNA-dependent DNA polymerase)
MEQPEGFHQDDFLPLLKGIYGLKQAGRIWHQKLDKELQEMDFVKVWCDHSIWVYQKGDNKVIIPVFVDDLTIASKSKEAVQTVKDELGKRFKLRDLGPTSFLPGVSIERD